MGESQITAVIASNDRPYGDRGDELADHLGRLRLLLQRAVERFRQRRLIDAAGLDGIAIFDAEVDTFLTSAAATEARRPLLSLDDAEAWALQVGKRSAATPREVALPLRALKRRYGLSRAELDLLLLCLAAEIDPGYGRVYAYLHNDVSRTRPTLALALDVLAEGWAARLDLRTRFGDRSPLIAARLLAHRGASPEPSLEDALTLDPTLLGYVLGAPSPLETLPEGRPLEDLLLAPATRTAAEQLEATLDDGGVVVCLAGAEGSGRRSIAASLAHARRRRVAVFELSEEGLPAGEAVSFDRWARDALLYDHWPCVDASLVTRDRLDATARRIARRFAELGAPVAFLVCSSVPQGGGVRVVEVKPIGAGLRAIAWRRFLGDSVAADDVRVVASVFPFTVAQIARAASAVSRQGRADGQALRLACRTQAQHRLDRLADCVPAVHGWDDIVLPRDQQRQLRELADAVERREHVLERWRFGEKVAVAPGVSAIFFGPSGTGKTMAAGILAAELGMALYRIDLSRVVSKYIGETEKNLDALFAEARRAYAVLFFDEADALFGKRSEVKDAHDRYANIEVAYLLQRMEAYEGVTVLATNLRANIDDAFLRRLQFAVEFPFPGSGERLSIWRKVWPPGTPLDDAVDLGFLAEQFELSGGQIRNVALRAAYLAAAEDRAISTTHLVAATRRELQKLGRLCVEGDFGRYAHLVAALERA